METRKLPPRTLPSWWQSLNSDPRRWSFYCDPNALDKLTHQADDIGSWTLELQRPDPHRSLYLPGFLFKPRNVHLWAGLGWETTGITSRLSVGEGLILSLGWRHFGGRVEGLAWDELKLRPLESKARSLSSTSSLGFYIEEEVFWFSEIQFPMRQVALPHQQDPTGIWEFNSIHTLWTWRLNHISEVKGSAC